MPLPVIAYFAAAGIAAAGGPLIGVYLFRRGSQEAAREEALADGEALRDLLEQAIDTAELRKRAEEAGVDPVAVVDGYRALQNGYLSVDEFISKVLSGQQAVPVTGDPPKELVAGENFHKPTAAEIRDWARRNGHDVADTGRLPNAVIEAYMNEHIG